MEKLEKFRRVLLGRIIASVVLYAVFAAMAVVGFVTENEQLQWWLVVPFVISVLIMPRRATPRDAEVPESEEGQELWEKLQRMTTWLQGVRFVYIAGAIFLLLILPELL